MLKALNKCSLSRTSLSTKKLRKVWHARLKKTFTFRLKILPPSKKWIFENFFDLGKKFCSNDFLHLLNLVIGCNDTQHNDIWYNDTQHNSETVNSVTLMLFWVSQLRYCALCRCVDCRYDKCGVITVSVIMLSVIKLSVIILSVVKLNVVL